MLYSRFLLISVLNIAVYICQFQAPNLFCFGVFFFVVVVFLIYDRKAAGSSAFFLTLGTK